MPIHIINANQLDHLLHKHQLQEPFPQTCYLCKQGGRFVAIDNTTGDMWTEEFETEAKAREWLEGFDDDFREAEKEEGTLKRSKMELYRTVVSVITTCPYCGTHGVHDILDFEDEFGYTGDPDFTATMRCGDCQADFEVVNE